MINVIMCTNDIQWRLHIGYLKCESLMFAEKMYEFFSEFTLLLQENMIFNT